MLQSVMVGESKQQVLEEAGCIHKQGARAVNACTLATVCLFIAIQDQTQG